MMHKNVLIYESSTVNLRPGFYNISSFRPKLILNEGGTLNDLNNNKNE